MGLSCLTDSTAAIVIDASTAINLNATGCAPAILKALPNRARITETVVAELEAGRRTGRRDGELIADLLGRSLLEAVRMNESQERLFKSLIIGSAVDTLDDGEAATIAVALDGRAVAIIDERKANRICAQRYPQVRTGCTIDLFAHEAVQSVLGAAALGDAIFAALQQARMRTLPRHLEWVVSMIGQDRAPLCPSLPRSVRCRPSVAKAG